ncbi:MAG: SPOR domain-containing protein [Pseudomonadota bacterium]
MSDTPLSQDAIGRDPAQLRRRARRRLVGAVAIALTAVVVVPMLFDPEPKPLGPDVDVRIPGQDTPFEPAPSAKPAAQPEPTAQVAEPTAPAAATPSPAPAPAPAATPPAAPAKVEPAQPPKEEKKAEPKPEAPPKAEPKKAEPKKQEAKKEEPPKPDPAFASKGYYLQLGAFGSEANAKTLLDKVRAAGFKAGVTGGNGQYRVRVGPITERDKALEMQAKLRGKGFSPVIIGP